MGSQVPAGGKSMGKLAPWSNLLQQIPPMSNDDYTLVHSMIVTALATHFHIELSDGSTTAIDADDYKEWAKDMTAMRDHLIAIERRAGGNHNMFADDGIRDRLTAEWRRVTWAKKPPEFQDWYALVACEVVVCA